MTSVGLRDEIASELISLGGEEKEVTWSGFVEAASKLIIKHYQSGSVEKYKQTWRKRFKETSKELGLKIKRDSSESNYWKDIVVVNLKPVSDSSGTSSTSTSSLNYQKQLTDDDKVLLKHVHEKIHKKWKLTDGIIVEDVIYEETKEYTVEHPFHSYIIHLNNLNVEELFGKNMLKEMEEYSGKRDLMTPLPDSLRQMLLNLNGKGNVDSMDDAFQKLTCNRRTEPDAYWCRESVINYLSLFMNQEDVIPFATEQDLLDDMYGFIKKTKNISNTTTETACGSSASGYNKNMKRLLGSTNRLERQAVGDHSDLTFRCLSFEIACVEIGLVDHGPKGTKELQEAELKTPTMMRSFCSQIVEHYRIKPSDIKLVSFIISGPYLTAEIMTFTKGSTAILYSSPRLKMPENIKEVPRLLPPVLVLVYNCSQVIKQTADVLKMTASSVNLDPFSNADFFFPPSFVPDSNSPSKKRKTFT